MKKIYRSLTHVASVFLLLFMAFAALAQSRVVTGTIADDQGGPMPGVNVVIKGTTTGTTTNASGVYSIEASENDILVVSFIGYTTQEIRVGSQTKIDVSLSEDIATLDEIVVVGYGTQKKSDLTGAVSRVGAEELKGSIVTNIDQALQGRVAGVNISSNSGAPGAATTINIRGISTFGGSQPLYVIDGVQMSGQGGMTAAFTDGANGNTVVNPLSTINPNDIESIDVLKDASAAAIYGSQASNGVIIITTKRGKAGAPKISYNTYYALQTPRKKLDVMNLREYASYRADVARDFGNDPAQQYLDPSILGKGTDWQDAIFRTAPMLSHDLSVSGGNDKTTYAIMGGYFKQDGMAINSGLSRFTTRMNLDTKLKDWFTLGTNISYSNVTENMIMDASGDGVISQALTMAPDVPVRDIDGNFAGPSQQNSGSAEMQSNPVGLAQMRVNDLKRQRFLINTYADASIIKNLNVRTELSIDNNFSQNINFSPSYKWGSLVEGESQLQDQRSNSFYWIWKTYATYNKNIGSHHFQLMVGHEMQKNKFEQTYVLKRNLANGDLLALSQGDQLNQTTNGQINENSLMSYYGRLEYDFKDKYLVKFILRGDGSSKFGPENRWGYFPAASIGWKVSNESFFPQSEIVSEIKLRAGYGEVGNQNIPNFAYTSTFGSVNSPFGTTYRLNNMENPAV
ncbi:MAG TPA: SusC/RagA family TonB-linked outer membrane protein, partial [Ohtaekwangia sp.]|nr:SusC/RagA family TonB-linked outer membrane protein [Ohtaekwangia sp.]